MIRPFGTLPGGETVNEVTLRAGSLEAAVLTYGATLRDLRLHGRPLVLGLNTLEDYQAHGAYFGGTCGRYANRIAAGRFTLDGVSHQVTCNEKGRNHLHGGQCGYDKKLWQIAELSASSLLLTLTSPDGEEGYPGNVDLRCRYTLLETGTLRLEMSAVTDQPTLVNLAHHSYFNLDSSGDISGHRLQILADRYLPVDADCIPTGGILPVAGTVFDFRTKRPIRQTGADHARVLYDHNFCVADTPSETLRLAAVLEGETSGVSMELWTTEPGVQFYDASGLGLPYEGLEGRRYGPHAGLCLEPQRWPDSPNHTEFAGAVLRPGTTYSQVTEFRFQP